MDILFLFVALIFLLLLWRTIPKPDIDRPHLITTHSARGGFTLRTIRNTLIAMLMISVVISAYVDPSNEGNDNRVSMIGAAITWLAIVSAMRLLRWGEHPYQLQWGDRIVTPNLWRVLERWGERITFAIVTIRSLEALF